MADDEKLKLNLRDIGRISYGPALELQQELAQKRIEEKIPDTLILVEHPPVITLGRKAPDSDILVSKETLNAAGAEVHRVTRGGEATYHGPGQIVGYTIIHLYQRQRQLRLFIERMEEIFIRLLDHHYGIAAHRDPEHRGVWVDDEKIAAIGISVSRRVTMHGFAFNVAPDLSHFDWIIPCGIRDRGVTSLSRLTGSVPDNEVVKNQIVAAFCQVYGYTVVP